MHLLGADLLVGLLAARCDLLVDLVPVVLELGDGVLQLCGAAEVLGSDAVLQSLLGLQDAHLHLGQLEMGP